MQACSIKGCMLGRASHYNKGSFCDWKRMSECSSIVHFDAAGVPAGPCVGGLQAGISGPVP